MQFNRRCLILTPFVVGQEHSFLLGDFMSLRMRVHDREHIGAALRRFKKLLERSGLIKELRSRRHYEKPCELRRRAEMRKKSIARRGKVEPRRKPSY
jgi:small subunit ribosomal protein S21